MWAQPGLTWEKSVNTVYLAAKTKVAHEDLFRKAKKYSRVRKAPLLFILPIELLTPQMKHCIPYLKERKEAFMEHGIRRRAKL